MRRAVLAQPARRGIVVGSVAPTLIRVVAGLVDSPASASSPGSSLGSVFRFDPGPRFVPTGGLTRSLASGRGHATEVLAACLLDWESRPTRDQTFV
ncbi:hypothetical protein [Knoellia subterranea]|uniref:Uncharacterized protein n=1 Tax=Knoellia subterranea KCTC 19937 TaxID=1385521 RepID=A0A0A0JHG4_9MICO|nr:hypothetical protein [Knoellia subterranea]KGN36543.1 hypothetical protein N803_04700 [Knoellia subterranea KCTC 19937]